MTEGQNEDLAREFLTNWGWGGDAPEPVRQFALKVAKVNPKGDVRVGVSSSLSAISRKSRWRIRRIAPSLVSHSSSSWHAFTLRYASTKPRSWRSRIACRITPNCPKLLQCIRWLRPSRFATSARRLLACLSACRAATTAWYSPATKKCFATASAVLQKRPPALWPKACAPRRVPFDLASPLVWRWQRHCAPRGRITAVVRAATTSADSSMQTGPAGLSATSLSTCWRPAWLEKPQTSRCVCSKPVRARSITAKMVCACIATVSVCRSGSKSRISCCKLPGRTLRAPG